MKTRAAASSRCPRVWLVLLVFALGLSRSHGQGTNALPHVTFLPHWIPQAQFAGYYMAAAKGFYRAHGLDVTILDGGPRHPVEKGLASGQATFASHFLSSALRLRDEGLPLVNIAQISQRSALMLVALKSRGIHSIQDLDGKKVSLWPAFSVQPRALFRKYHLHVHIITQGATLNLLLRGGVAAASAMWYNEYHLLVDTGLNPDELTLIFFDKYGLNFPEDGIYCLAQTERQHPAMCRHFVQATLEGWRYAFAHTNETLTVVMQRAARAHTGTNLAHQEWMLARMHDLIQPVSADTQMGQLSRSAYERVVRELEAAKEIKSAPTFEQFYVPLHP